MDLVLWTVGFLVLLLGLYLLGTRTFDRFTKLGIPFVAPLPFLGNMSPFVFRTNSFGDIFLDIYNKYKGCGLIGMFQFTKPMVMVCDPELIKLITVKDFDHFSDHVAPVTEDEDPFFGKVIFVLRGDRWRHMRNTLSPAFTSAKMKAMCLLVDECGDQLGQFVERTITDSSDGLASLDMKDMFTRYTNDVIATSAFGVHVDSLAQPHNEFYKMGKRAASFGGIQAFKLIGFLLSPGVMKFLKIPFTKASVERFFCSLVTDTMAKRNKEGIYRPDMIHLLMEAKRDASKSDAGDAKKAYELTDMDIAAQAFLFFFAGFDTASTHLCFLFHLLAIHPTVQRRVQAEIDAVLATDDGHVTYDGLARLKYTEMCMSEALRLYPPGIITDRKCVKAYTLPATASSPSIRLNPGDCVVLPIYPIHRDAKYFPEPEKFDPERFSEERKKDINPFAYIPFGVGPRVCIGQRFALMETKVAIVSLLSRYDLLVTEKTQTTLVLNKKNFNMGVEGGFWLGLRKRNK